MDIINFMQHLIFNLNTKIEEIKDKNNFDNNKNNNNSNNNNNNYNNSNNNSSKNINNNDNNNDKDKYMLFENIRLMEKKKKLKIKDD